MNRFPVLRLALLVSLALSTADAVAAEPPTAAPSATPSGSVAAAVAYKGFLAQVGRANLELLAQRGNVSIAEAQIAVARIFPDLQLTAGLAAIDVSGAGQPTATTVGLSYLVELGGKRGARIAAANAESATVRAELEDFTRTLRGTATVSFIDALYARLVVDLKQRTLKGFEKLVAVNEERLRSGDLGKVALTQSRVEAQRFRGEVRRAQADVEAADIGLRLYVGGAGSASFTPAGDLQIKPRSYNVETLITQAKANRPDLTAKQRALQSAGARVSLARANRWIDVTLGAGWQHSFAGRDPMANPKFDSLAATVTVPIPFSKVYRGELDAALATQAQGRTTVRAVELKIDVEVRQAHARYLAAVDRLKLYTGGVLADADVVLDATLFNYQRGGATLLEVLDAQRTVNEVYLAYYDALADHARSLVALEQAVGTWDVEF